MKATLLLVVLGMALTSCGGSSPNSKTALTFVAVSPGLGRAAIRLQCGPPGGDLPQPEVVNVCNTLRKRPGLVTSPRAFNCLGGPFWTLTITGRLNGKPVNRRLGTCWTFQMPTIGLLDLSTPGTSFPRDLHH